MSAARAWAARQLAPWQGRGLTQAAVSQRLDALLPCYGQLFRYDLRGTEVIRRPKLRDHIARGRPDSVVHEVEARADAYADFLRQSLPLAGLRREVSLGIEVSDIPPDIPELPFFAFQRLRGEAVMLLPDVELFACAFLEDRHWVDPYAFRRKRNQAVFVGSTTDSNHSLESVRALSSPRLRAAQAFKDSASVVFRLPRIVQCDTPETAAAIEAMGFGGPEVSWADQMPYRHLLSMDGNGATCSRVAVALHSNSVLLKYDSPYELFYFPALLPWRHYVPIAGDAEVEAVVADSARRPERYARIAYAGRRFFRAHLTRAACQRYVAALLRGYAELLAS